MNDHIHRAERKEKEARDLLREAASLRDLARRLEEAALLPQTASEIADVLVATGMG
jgi:hypothetical protein